MNTIKINKSTTVPTENILYLASLNEAERKKLTEKYNKVSESKFHTRIKFANKKTKLIIETIEDLKSQGLALIDIGSDKFVPVSNFDGARELTKEDIKELQASNGYNKSEKDFKSGIETCAGLVWSVLGEDEVINRERQAKRFQPSMP